LSSTKVLGHPLEYFNGPGRRSLGLRDFPDDPLLQVEAILRIGATPNRVYAVKLFASTLATVSKTIKWTGALPNLRFIYLRREDLLGQAISWVRALQTSQYRSTQNSQGIPIYDVDLIHSHLVALVREQAQWEAYFARTGILPLRIVYEHLLQDPAAQVRRIASIMEVARAVVDQSKIDLVIQRDAVSDEWRQRFQRERGDPNVIDAV
jgi:LPS sulfotransferase NodH